MNRIEKALKDSADIKEFARKYFDYLGELLNNMDMDAIYAFSKELEKARHNRNTVFFIGNGGSAATASHMANDFGGPLRAFSLTDNSAVMLAIANDDGYNTLFVNQLQVHYRPGDKLVAISVSGNSPNVIKAAEWVKEKGGTVMSLVGFDGGKLKGISDITICVEAMKGEYGPVEDIHLVVNHFLSRWIQEKAIRVQIKSEVDTVTSAE